MCFFYLFFALHAPSFSSLFQTGFHFTLCFLRKKSTIITIFFYNLVNCKGTKETYRSAKATALPHLRRVAHWWFPPHIYLQPPICADTEFRFRGSSSSARCRVLCGCRQRKVAQNDPHSQPSPPRQMKYPSSVLHLHLIETKGVARVAERLHSWIWARGKISAEQK